MGRGVVLRTAALFALGAVGLAWFTRPNPVIADLARHHEQVVGPLIAAEQALLETLEPLAGNPAALARACEAKVVPIYRERLRAAERYRPRTAEVRALNDVLVEEYRGATSVLERWAASQNAGTPDAAKSAAHALAALEMTRTREAVERAYERNGFDPTARTRRPLD